MHRIIRRQPPQRRHNTAIARKSQSDDAEDECSKPLPNSAGELVQKFLGGSEPLSAASDAKPSGGS